MLQTKKLSKSKRSPINCVEKIRGFRNQTSMWIEFLIDNTSDIITEKGNREGLISACRVDIAEALLTLRKTRKELRHCNCISDISKELFKSQLNDIQERLQKAIDDFQRVAA